MRIDIESRLSEITLTPFNNQQEMGQNYERYRNQLNIRKVPIYMYVHIYMHAHIYIFIIINL